jgi:Protein of unknown function (DUF3307)
MMFSTTANQLFLHLVGDFVLQSRWMAAQKTYQHRAALCHAAAYTLALSFATRSPIALLLIFGSHFTIDRWRLARYVCYAQNFLAPIAWWLAWEDCDETGHWVKQPQWLTLGLLIVVDNVMHIWCNAIAIGMFG